MLLIIDNDINYYQFWLIKTSLEKRIGFWKSLSMCMLVHEHINWIAFVNYMSSKRYGLRWNKGNKIRHLAVWQNLKRPFSAIRRCTWTSLTGCLIRRVFIDLWVGYILEGKPSRERWLWPSYAGLALNFSYLVIYI